MEGADDEETIALALIRPEDATSLIRITLTATSTLGGRTAAESHAKSIAAINETLKRAGLSEEYEEVLVLREPIAFRCQLRVFSTSWLSHLKRIQAHLIKDPSWTVSPVTAGINAEDDEIFDELYAAGIRTHLICHATEGFYIPLASPDMAPLFDASGTLPGGWLGSSVSLLDELLDLTPALNIGLRSKSSIKLRRAGGIDISDEALESLRLELEEATRSVLWIERLVWFALYEAARLSVLHHCAIELL